MCVWNKLEFMRQLCLDLRLAFDVIPSDYRRVYRKCRHEHGRDQFAGSTTRLPGFLLAERNFSISYRAFEQHRKERRKRRRSPRETRAEENVRNLCMMNHG
jgi:hypothetical protein